MVFLSQGNSPTHTAHTGHTAHMRKASIMVTFFFLMGLFVWCGVVSILLLDGGFASVKEEVVESRFQEAHASWFENETSLTWRGLDALLGEGMTEDQKQDRWGWKAPVVVEEVVEVAPHGAHNEVRVETRVYRTEAHMASAIRGLWFPQTHGRWHEGNTVDITKSLAYITS